MRHIKVLLAGVAAGATMMVVVAAPAMAETNELTQTIGGVSNTISSDNDDADFGGVLIVGGEVGGVDSGGIELDNVSGGITLVGSNVSLG